MKKVFCNLIFHKIFINIFSATFVMKFLFRRYKKEEPRLKKRKMHQIKIKNKNKNHNHLPNYEAQLKEMGFIN